MIIIKKWFNIKKFNIFKFYFSNDFCPLFKIMNIENDHNFDENGLDYQNLLGFETKKDYEKSGMRS